MKLLYDEPMNDPNKETRLDIYETALTIYESNLNKYSENFYYVCCGICNCIKIITHTDESYDSEKFYPELYRELQKHDNSAYPFPEGHVEPRIKLLKEIIKQTKLELKAEKDEREK